MATAHLIWPRFMDQMDRVHLDEKWFHMCQDGEGYLLCSDEEMPRKGHVLLCAQARPRWDFHTHSQWDGKIGLWPIGKYTLAQQSSKHRPAGTTEWENVNMMCNDLYRDMLINYVLPEVMNKWPVAQWNNPDFKIRIQQDGAGGHTASMMMPTWLKHWRALGSPTRSLSTLSHRTRRTLTYVTWVSLMHYRLPTMTMHQGMKWSSSSPWWSKPTLTIHMGRLTGCSSLCRDCLQLHPGAQWRQSVQAYSHEQSQDGKRRPIASCHCMYPCTLKVSAMHHSSVVVVADANKLLVDSMFHPCY
jgi:hypothetical protein